MTNEEAVRILRSDAFNTNKRTHEAVLMAIEALRKQAPKKPNETTDTAWGIERKQAVCPMCDYYLGNVHFIGDGKKVSYCETCGQAIDWEGWKYDD